MLTTRRNDLSRYEVSAPDHVRYELGSLAPVSLLRQQLGDGERPWASIQGGCGHNRPARRGAGSDRGCLARLADLASASSRCPRPAPASGCGSGSECGRGRGGPCAPAPAEGRRHVLARNSAVTTSTCRSLPSVVISMSLTCGQHIAGEQRERHSRIERAGQHVHHCCGLVANSTSSGMPAARHRSPVRRPGLRKTQLPVDQRLPAPSTGEEPPIW